MLGLVLGLLLAVGPAAAFAQDVLLVNAPFAFLAAGKTHPAGEYRLTISEDKMELTITPAKGPATVMPVVTRLASSDSPAQADRAVFDEVNNTYTLSELWGGPREDGYLLHTTKGPHNHHTVKLGRKAK
jgi:hypothetical protein